MLSSFGKNIQVNIYGGSHEPEIGVIIKGLPLDTQFDIEVLQQFMDRRAPGNSPFATARKEPDRVIPVDGLHLKGSTAYVTDTEIKLIIKNTNTRSQDYKTFRDIPRPGHADYTAHVKYGDGLPTASHAADTCKSETASADTRTSTGKTDTAGAGYHASTGCRTSASKTGAAGAGYHASAGTRSSTGTCTGTNHAGISTPPKRCANHRHLI